jgi:hypothetical protein
MSCVGNVGGIGFEAEMSSAVFDVVEDGVVIDKSGFSRGVRVIRCFRRQSSQVRYRLISQDLRQRQREQIEEDIID